MDMFSQFVKVFPNIMSEFPEVEWKRLNSMVEEDSALYGIKNGTNCQARLDRLMSDHLDLLKMYNELSMKYVELVK